MYLVKSDDLYAVVTMIGRLPDRYIKEASGKWAGVYNKLSAAELRKICRRGIKL